MLEQGSKVALMPRDARDREGPFKWRVLTPSRTWEFTNETDEEMKNWVRMIARIVNPELTFGMPLTTVIARCKKRGYPANVPLIVITLMQFLRDNDGVNVEGIFRMSGDQNSIKQLKSRFNTEPDNTVVVHRDTDVHVVTGTLKYFLRELESALIPHESNAFLRAILGLPSVKEKIVGYRKLIETLPVENAATLQFILKYLHQVAANSSVNLMTTQNLAVVFGPCFIRSEPGAIAFQDADMQLNSVNTMVEQYTSIFPNEDLISSANAIQPPTTSSASGLSSFTSAIGGGAGGIGSATLHSSGGAGAAGVSSPPSFLPPPPNRNPPAPVIPGGAGAGAGGSPSPSPASIAFNRAGPGMQTRENAIVIGSGGPTTSPPPSHNPPPPSHAPADPSLFASRPPAFAPPSAPAGSASAGSLTSSTGEVHTSPISVPTSSSASPPDSTGVTPSSSFVSMYDSSSEDDELAEVLADVLPRQDRYTIEDESLVVTSLDDLEGEDGSIDVSKIFGKGAVVNINMSNSRGRTWTSSKPTGTSNSTPPPSAAMSVTAVSPIAAAPTAAVTGTSSIAAPVSPAPVTSTPPPATTGSGSLSSSASIPADAPTAAAGGDEVRNWLMSLGEDYVPYAAILAGEGFKTIKQLSDINDEDMKELGIKMAHRKAMRAAIDKI